MYRTDHIHTPNLYLLTASGFTRGTVNHKLTSYKTPRNFPGYRLPPVYLLIRQKIAKNNSWRQSRVKSYKR